MGRRSFRLIAITMSMTVSFQLLAEGNDSYVPSSVTCDTSSIANPDGLQLLADAKDCLKIYVLPPSHGQVTLARYTETSENGSCQALEEFQQRSEPTLRRLNRMEIARERFWLAYVHHLEELNLYLPTFHSACQGIEQESEDFSRYLELKDQMNALEKEIDRLEQQDRLASSSLLEDDGGFDTDTIAQLERAQSKRAELAARLDAVSRTSRHAMRWCQQALLNKKLHWHKITLASAKYLDIERKMIEERSELLRLYKQLASLKGGEATFRYSLAWDQAISALAELNDIGFQFLRAPIHDVTLHTSHSLMTDEKKFIATLPAITDVHSTFDPISSQFTLTIDLTLASTCSLRLGQTPDTFHYTATYLYPDHLEAISFDLEFNIDEIVNVLEAASGPSRTLTQEEIVSLAKEIKNNTGFVVPFASMTGREKRIASSYYLGLILYVMTNLSEPILRSSNCDGDQPHCIAGYILPADNDPRRTGFLELHDKPVFVPKGTMFPHWRQGVIHFFE